MASVAPGDDEGQIVETNITHMHTLCDVLLIHPSTSDLASTDLHIELAQFGQFAELAYAALKRFNVQFVFDHIDILSRPDFPLEGYDALREATLVLSARGSVADIHILVAYRASTRQLIVGFQGTANLKQFLYDLDASKQSHPSGPGCAVHSGFWKLYQGCRAQVFEGVRKGLREHDVRELVSVGHSMGGVLAHLFVLDVLSSETPLSPGLLVTVASYGCARFGNAALADRWQEVVEAYKVLNGNDSVHEYTVRAFNDGVPCVPPTSLGYKHLTRTPLYYYHGRLFHVPATESEHGVFTFSEGALDATKIPDYPRGGHNYYNGRDWEKVVRRIFWLNEILEKHGNGWEDEYIAYLAKHDPEWQSKV
ncbi:alpha/beta-hydrolase [Amylocystis lapponica]|nr:alpha/beta-hydrolase [Amylocystis lapponica]